VPEIVSPTRSDHVAPGFQPLDREGLRRAFQSAEPFPHIVIDGLLEPDLARSIAAAYPDATTASRLGKTFHALNERGKTQVTDPAQFAPSVRQLNALLASPEWLETISYVTGIPRLLADPQLVGGGMHIMRPGALLDVHVDFNLLEDRALHRRLNILMFLNEGWKAEWGGRLELWDPKVRHCVRRFEPQLNRCVLFETSEISYHGVEKLKSTAGRSRLSFAAYYYTEEPPPRWNGRRHTTMFRARPDERLKGLLMPVAKVGRRLSRPFQHVARLARMPAKGGPEAREGDVGREQE